jgi:hypothetical protein
VAAQSSVQSTTRSQRTGEGSQGSGLWRPRTFSQPSNRFKHFENKNSFAGFDT